MTASYPSLTHQQKEAVGLLQIGTFLEYFDLMLYVHMAVLLNELFFPKTDPHTASLLAAFAFCSTYVLRPFGALLFGYIGDHIGRKTTVVLTTMMMAISCIVMAHLPTYAQMGITAAWLVTLCRIVQGLSSMGEIIGAEIYLTETIKAPANYPIVASVVLSSAIGTTFALAIAFFVTSSGLNWRVAFWIGAGIALVGTAARTRLRETPEFVDMKKRMKNAIEDAHRNNMEVMADLLKSVNQTWKEKISKKSVIAYFLIRCGWPVFFYFSYVHCAGILKTQFGYMPEQIIRNNFYVSLAQMAGFSLMVIACIWIYPLKILKIKNYVMTSIILFLPWMMNHLTSSMHVFCLQSIIIFFGLTNAPGVPIFLKYFPVYRRFTCDSFIYALSRAVMYVFTSFGLVYLIELFGNWGLWIIMFPLLLGYSWGVHHFETLEKATGEYPTDFSWGLFPSFTRKTL